MPWPPSKAGQPVKSETTEQTTERHIWLCQRKLSVFLNWAHASPLLSLNSKQKRRPAFSVVLKMQNKTKNKHFTRLIFTAQNQIQIDCVERTLKSQESRTWINDLQSLTPKVGGPSLEVRTLSLSRLYSMAGSSSLLSGNIFFSPMYLCTHQCIIYAHFGLDRPHSLRSLSF